MQATVMRG